MINTFGDDFKTPGTLSGMVGTTPLTPITDDFKQRLLAVDPTLTDFNYAGESYDAVILSALAVEESHSLDPAVVSKYVDGITVLAADGVECNIIKDCLDGIAAGKHIAYRGISVRDGFTDVGEPSTTMYGTLHFGRDNQIDSGKTEFVSAGSNNNSTKKGAPAPVPPATRYNGRPLTLGILLPKTGDLSIAGPPMFAGAHLAIKEINDAGGILGKPVNYIDSDDATDPTKAGEALDKLVQQNVPIVIGPSTSGESVALIPKAVAANRILFSPCATSAALSTADDHGLYFRTSPPDTYQSAALADVIMRSGSRRVFIVARNDSYGTGLLDGVTTDLKQAGIGGGDIQSATYTSKQKDFSDIAKSIAAFKPDSVLLAGYDESAGVIQAMQAKGLTLAGA